MNAYFLSFEHRNYSRSSVLLNYPSPIVTKEYVKISYNLGSASRELYRLKKNLKDNPVIVIMSPSHKLAILAKLIIRKPLILDAGWPLTDGIVSRKRRFAIKLKLIPSYMLDLFSFHSANHILVESNAQLLRIKRRYFIVSKKLRVSFTGLNETEFSKKFEPSKKVNDLKFFIHQEANRLVVLFRGKINNESGIEIILGAAKCLEGEAVFILLTAQSKRLSEAPLNCYVVTDVTENEMAQIYDLADITLGQLSNHPRLKYTIPHKAFESGFFSKCYVSAKSSGIQELFSEKSAHLIENVSIENLVTAIRTLSQTRGFEAHGKLANASYRKLASQEVLNSKFDLLVLDIYSE